MKSEKEPNREKKPSDVWNESKWKRERKYRRRQGAKINPQSTIRKSVLTIQSAPKRNSFIMFCAKKIIRFRILQSIPTNNGRKIVYSLYTGTKKCLYSLFFIPNSRAFKFCFLYFCLCVYSVRLFSCGYCISLSPLYSYIHIEHCI